MRSISLLSLFKFAALCLFLAVGGLFAHSCTLTSRACRDNVVCMIRELGEKLSDASDAVTQVTVYGYKCVNLLCKSSCVSDVDCDADQGYKCDTTTNKSGLCRCDTKDLKKPCHSQCFTAEECHARVDPDSKKPLYPKEAGWTCQTNATNPNVPGVCVSSNEPVAEATVEAAPSETIEEAGPSEDRQTEANQDD